MHTPPKISSRKMTEQLSQQLRTHISSRTCHRTIIAHTYVHTYSRLRTCIIHTLVFYACMQQGMLYRCHKSKLSSTKQKKSYLCS